MPPRSKNDRPVPAEGRGGGGREAADAAERNLPSPRDLPRGVAQASQLASIRTIQDVCGWCSLCPFAFVLVSSPLLACPLQSIITIIILLPPHLCLARRLIIINSSVGASPVHSLLAKRRATSVAANSPLL